MRPFVAFVRPVGGGLVLVIPVDSVDPGFGVGAPPVDPGYGQGHPFPDRPDNSLPWGPNRPDQGLPGYSGPVDPGYGQGHPRPDHPSNALPVPPVRPANPIVLPPGMWPPALPPGIDNSLPGVPPDRPIFVPPNPDIGIEQPIYLPTLPPHTAILIALPVAAPKQGTPPGTQPALLYQPGKKPVLVYVQAAPQPK